MLFVYRLTTCMHQLSKVNKIYRLLQPTIELTMPLITLAFYKGSAHQPFGTTHAYCTYVVHFVCESLHFQSDNAYTLEDHCGE
jgi:hypothetical protein